ncbi:MAG: serine--tRNA ligase [Candidatus Fermentibacteria bacterium]
MLDRALLRNDPDTVRAAALSKGEPCPIDEWLQIDKDRRRLLAETEKLRRRRNELSKEVSSLKREGKNADELILESREAGTDLSSIEENLAAVNIRMAELELHFPNIPDPGVPAGSDEASNRIFDPLQPENRQWVEDVFSSDKWDEFYQDCRTGVPEKPSFTFNPLPHWELMGEYLDSNASGRITGSNFILLRGWAARLQRILINWMMDFHEKAGMEEIWSPFLATRESMTMTGQIPKLESDMYQVEKDDLFLIPTGEVPLTNIFRGRTFSEKELPVCVFGYTPCFRREAGSYGKENRGLNRVHQFEKVEMVRVESPGRSEAAVSYMVWHVISMLQELELPWRCSLLATGDLSFAAAKCYDLEVWAAGQEKWLEVSSISNFRDFQARRGNIKFKPSGGGKPEFVHTLNGSALALPRIMAALIENGQTESGKIVLPGVLAERAGTEFLD